MVRTQFQKSLLALSVGLALTSLAQVSHAAGATTVGVNSATGMARFVRAAAPAPVTGKLNAQRGARVMTDEAKVSGAVQFLSDNGSLFGIRNAATELVTARIDKDVYGGTHITHKQVYQGLPVFAAELKTHYDAAGNLTAANGTFIPDINVNSAPSRSADQAKATALARVTGELGRQPSGLTTQATLMIYREGLAKGVPGANHLVWQVEVGNRADVRDFIYVDAHTGKVIDQTSGIHDAKNRRAFDGLNVTAPGPNYPSSPFWVEGQAFPTGTLEADNMIEASSEIYDLFKNGFGRDSFDANGKTMDSIFNRGNACPNASWNGTFISFCPGTTTDDVTAHEWGHAYTEYTHGLVYHFQPGALNEAYSDIWGETVDRLNGRGGDTPDAPRTTLACTAFTNATQIVVTAPAAIAGLKSAGTAAFGPQTFSVPSTSVVVVNDGSGTANDGCETPFVNAADVAGKIAFMDRGVCGFAVKAKNAQLNGAIGVIIGNNAAGAINMSGDDATITIPSLSMLQADGTALKAQAAGSVAATLQRGPGADNSVRWLIGEDSTAFGGAIRDMYNPTCYGNPGKVTDTQYSCGADTSAGDWGGVHGNSGVPNHGYALLVDGGVYNGQTVSGIGLTKAAHIYYRAQSVYQTPGSSFADHADAIEQSCADLTGASLANLKTGLPSGEVISATDCAQVAKMALAIELRTPATQCNYGAPILGTNPPAMCPSGAATTLMSDSFDGGKRGGAKWSVTYAGVTGDFTARNWGVVTNLPGSRPGYAIFGVDYTGGTCAVGGDQSGVMRLESPEVTIPAGTTMPRLSFDHWVATEAGYDGGNVKISVNGGAWQLVKGVDFVYNPYNTTLTSAAGGNTNPLAGQAAFSGTNPGTVSGSWGRSIVNLAPYATANDVVKLRFEMGTDGCGGTYGWYVDDVSVYRCTP